jgi:hypothetical protein
MAMSHVNNGPLPLIGDSVPKPLGFTAFAPEMAASWRCGAASAARAIPASESALRSHPCVAVSSAQVKSV